MDLNPLIAQIAADNISGATDLTRKAAAVLADAVRMAPPEQLAGTLRDCALRLIQAQPAMGSILRLANEVLFAWDKAVAREPLPRRLGNQVADAALAFVEQMEAGARNLVKHSAQLIGPGCRILTLSQSSLVHSTLLAAHQAGKKIHLTCCESRPAREGLLLANALAAEGVEVTIIADALAPSFVRKQDLLLLGADAVLPDELLAKAGAYGLCLAAMVNAVPVYVLCGTEKFVPQDARPLLRNEPHSPLEILPPEAKGIRAENLYFDFVPLSCVRGLVTEVGLLRPQEVPALLSQVSLHPILAQATTPARPEG